MDFQKDAILSTLMRLPRKRIFDAYGVGMKDFVQALLGDRPNAQAVEKIKSTLASLECDGKITLLRMDASCNDGPILGIQLNEEF